MSKSIQAVLLSALVFPGAGHFFLKKHVLGCVLAVISGICLYLLLSTVFGISSEINTKIQTGEMVFDTQVINDTVREKLTGGGYEYLGTSALIFIICWIIGVIDSFKAGRLQDKSDAGGKAF